MFCLGPCRKFHVDTPGVAVGTNGDAWMCESCYHSEDQPWNKLRTMADMYGVRDFSEIVIGDTRFPVWSGSSKEYQHHYGRSGLAQHTYEVCDLCIKNNSFFDTPVEPRYLFLAALFHDSGKMWDYAPTHTDHTSSLAYTQWIGTTHKRRIHHISRSGILWSKTFSQFPIGDENNHDDVLHAILAHHQLREWGSPVMPNTRMAWLLHLCDGLSARMDDCDKWDMVKT